MNVLIIGYGSMGRRHAMNAHNLGHEVRCADVKPAHLLNLLTGLTTVDEGRHWADAIVIATPAETHPELFWQVAQTRARILIEKPLACSADALLVNHLADLVRLDWDRAMVGYNLRHHEGLVTARAQHLPRIGEPVTATIRVRCDMAEWPGGAYADALLECSHEIDLALWMLGPARLAGAASRGDRVWTLLLRHDSGCVSTVVLDGRFAGYQRGGEVVGTDGVWRWGWHAPTARFESTLRVGNRKVARYALEITADDTYRREMAAFLRGDTSTACDLASAFAVLRTCDDTRKLARVGDLRRTSSISALSQLPELPELPVDGSAHEKAPITGSDVAVSDSL